MINLKDFLMSELKERQLNAEGLQNVAKTLLGSVAKNNAKDQYYRLMVLNPILNRLTEIYLELRHYTGKWPIVYTEDQIIKYPYLEGTTDDTCNPYYRASLVQSKQSDGLDPIFSEPTRTGGPNIVRDRNWPIAHEVAKAAIAAYPDLSGEPVSTPPWNPSMSAPAKLQDALTAWSADIDLLLNELYGDDTVVKQQITNHFTAIKAEITNCLTLIPPPPTYPTQTPPAGGALASSLSTLTNYANGIPSFIATRQTSLQNTANADEQDAFAVIKIRIHSVNGTYSATKGGQSATNTVKSALKDQIQASQTLSRLITKIPGL